MTTENDEDGTWTVIEQSSGAKQRLLITPSAAFEAKRAASAPAAVEPNPFDVLKASLIEKGVISEIDVEASRIALKIKAGDV